MSESHIKDFLERHFRHFNAAVLIEAANAYRRHLEGGGQMLVSLAGAMSTAELGLSLAEMIRQEKVHAICCTGANLEEDVFNLIAHDSYKRLPHYQDLTPADEVALHQNRLNRVTDTCIPEDKAVRKLETAILDEWISADKSGQRLFPHEFLYALLRNERFADLFEIDAKDSWVYAAMKMDLPIFVPGWEDSTLGNIYAAHCISGNIKNASTVKTGIEYFIGLAEWYRGSSRKNPVGFFQIGGGIAGDFAICVVPMLREDLQMEGVPLWAYYCQISDSTTSYGSYSGAPPTKR